MSSKADVGDLENSLPSWIFNHLDEKSYMAEEITQLPSSPRKDTPRPEVRPSADDLPLIEGRLTPGPKASWIASKSYSLFLPAFK